MNKFVSTQYAVDLKVAHPSPISLVTVSAKTRCTLLRLAPATQDSQISVLLMLLHSVIVSFKHSENLELSAEDCLCNTSVFTRLLLSRYRGLCVPRSSPWTLLDNSAPLPQWEAFLLRHGHELVLEFPCLFRAVCTCKNITYIKILDWQLGYQRYMFFIFCQLL